MRRARAIATSWASPPKVLADPVPESSQDREALVDPLERPGPRRLARRERAVQRHGEVPLHGERREDPAIVRHPGDPPPREQVGRQPRDVGTVEGDPAAPGRDQPEDALDGGRLPSPVPAEEADGLARPDLERQPPQNLGVAVEGVDPLDREEDGPGRERTRHARAPRWRGPEASQIRLADLGVVPDRRRRTLRDDPAPVEHRDVVREGEDEVHVVLDHDDREARGELLDQLAERLHRPHPEPARRLVEEEQLRLPGQRHADLEQPALAVGKVTGGHSLATGQPDQADDLRRPVLRLAHGAGGRPAIEAPRPHGGHRHPHVLEHRVVVEEVQNLKGAADSQARPAVRGQAGDVPPLEADRARVGREKACQEVEARRLACSVRPDEGGEPAGLEGEVHTVQTTLPPNAFRRPRASRTGAGAGAPARRRHGSRLVRALPVGAPRLAPRAAWAVPVSWNPAG